MFYDAELTFLQSVLKNYRLSNMIVTPETVQPATIDLGLRELLGLDSEYRKLTDFLTKQIVPKQIYRITDSFLCTYLFLLLPEKKPSCIMVIGPFLTHDITRQTLLQLNSKSQLPPHVLPVLEKYYINLPVLQDDVMLLSLLNAFGEKLWGSTDAFSMESVNQRFAEHDAPIRVNEPADTLFNMQALETRYATENKLLQAVSQGLSHKAEMLMGNLSSTVLEQRITDPVRNLKNYAIIMNTLLRKAAEQGAVHPLHIDHISADFAHKIEEITTIEGGYKLPRDMVRKYCLLVKNHSMKGYSLLVQKVITRIDSDLTADLSLNTLAGLQNVNPSYLSTRFKKETGSTLTDYVNRRRIGHAILLLNTTPMQVQTVAQYCGISDVNYFTKIFKKYINKTPKEYRENISQNSPSI